MLNVKEMFLFFNIFTQFGSRPVCDRSSFNWLKCRTTLTDTGSSRIFWEMNLQLCQQIEKFIQPHSRYSKLYIFEGQTYAFFFRESFCWHFIISILWHNTWLCQRFYCHCDQITKSRAIITQHANKMFYPELIPRICV